MFRLTTFVAAVALLAVAASATSMQQHPRLHMIRSEPPTVSAVNITQYLGRWYNMYQDLFTSVTFQNNSFCATATYGLEEDGQTISVFNWERQYSVTGPTRSIKGIAYQSKPKEAPGKLTVVLDTAAGRFPAPYWILDLGPIANNKYEYAVVSDEARLTLFVLARDVQTFKAKYEATVLARIKALGFTSFVDKPFPLIQEGCTYPEQ